MQRPTFARHLAIVALAVAAQAAMARDDCDAPPETWQPRSAVQALAERNGWQVSHLKIDDGCYEIKGHDAEGRRIKARIDPATLEIVGLRRGHRERERQRDRGGKVDGPQAPPG